MQPPRSSSGQPTKRYGEAPEIAAVVAFLLSDDASYVNATVVPIDGGQSAKYERAARASDNRLEARLGSDVSADRDSMVGGHLEGNA